MNAEKNRPVSMKEVLGADTGMEQPTGRLSLVFRKRASSEKTYVAEQYFKLPLQIMNPHYQDEDGTAFIYLLNPSGGILQHDRLLTEICLEEGSKALVTTPSAAKYYKMDEGYAKVANRLTVKSGAVLEYLPEHNVPFAGSRTWQENDFYLDRDSILIASDMVTAGRISRGERFQYDLYASRTRIYVGGKLRICDNSRMEPGRMRMEGTGMMEEYQTSGSIYVYSPEKKQDLPERLNLLQQNQGNDVRFAAGYIDENLMIVRFLGNDIISLQNMIFTVWDELRKQLLGKPAVRIRKY